MSEVSGTPTVVPVPEAAGAQAHLSELRRVIKVFFKRKLAAAGFVILIIFIITAIFCPLFAPYDPYKNLKIALQDPEPITSARH
jgi:ABC-type antimicrobial peptide transport system permease subunit